MHSRPETGWQSWCNAAMLNRCRYRGKSRCASRFQLSDRSPRCNYYATRHVHNELSSNEQYLLPSMSGCLLNWVLDKTMLNTMTTYSFRIQGYPLELSAGPAWERHGHQTCACCSTCVMCGHVVNNANEDIFEGVDSNVQSIYARTLLLLNEPLTK